MRINLFARSRIWNCVVHTVLVLIFQQIIWTHLLSKEEESIVGTETLLDRTQACTQRSQVELPSSLERWRPRSAITATAAALHRAQLLLERGAELCDRTLVCARVNLLPRLPLSALVCVQQTRDAAVEAADLLRRCDGAHSARDPVRKLRVARLEPLDHTTRHRAMRQPGPRRQPPEARTVHTDKPPVQFMAVRIESAARCRCRKERGRTVEPPRTAQ